MMLPSALPGRIGLVGDRRRKRPDAVDELIEVACDAQPIPVRAEVADHHAERCADLTLDVDVPRLHPPAREIRVDRVRREAGGQRRRWPRCSSRMLPANVSGVASGGFDDVGDTTLVTGMSTMTA